MTDTIKGEGILWVRSRIAQSAKDILDEETFFKWYDEEHIGEVVRTSGIRSGFRYLDIDKTSSVGDEENPNPFLAFYPMADLSFTLSDEFRDKIGFYSKNLPGTGIVYDLAEFDVSYMGFLNATETKGGEQPAGYVLTCGIRPQNEPEKESVDRFYEIQTAVVSQFGGYRRTLRFQLQYARSNAQTRKLKGLPTTDGPLPEPSKWLAIHEFSTLPSKDVVEDVKQGFRDAVEQVGENESDVHVWRLEKIHGTGEFFL
jgi:hypothetical protein